MLLKLRLDLEGRHDPALNDDKLLEAMFDSIDAKRSSYLNRYAPELPSCIETIAMSFVFRGALKRRLGCEMGWLCVCAYAHKFWAMVKMLGGVWDESLIYDTQVHIYKTRFYSHSVEENVDQVDDMKLIGSSHAFFWMFLPFQAFAVLTKLGERKQHRHVWIFGSDLSFSLDLPLPPLASSTRLLPCGNARGATRAGNGDRGLHG